MFFLLVKKKNKLPSSKIFTVRSPYSIPLLIWTFDDIPTRSNAVVVCGLLKTQGRRGLWLARHSGNMNALYQGLHSSLLPFHRNRPWVLWLSSYLIYCVYIFFSFCWKHKRRWHQRSPSIIVLTHHNTTKGALYAKIL